MRNLIRNMTLSAAALAATLVMAPTVSADQRGDQRGRVEHRETPRRNVDQSRGFNRNEGYRAHAVTRFYAPRFYAPFRVVSGVSFYSYCPGPGYVYVDDGWVLPPFFGAVWVPAHYDRFGIWCGGHWR